MPLVRVCLPFSSLSVSLALSLLFVGCTGMLSSNSDGPNDPGRRESTAGPLTCDPELTPGWAPLKRLTVTQYRNTLYDLLANVDPVLPEVDGALTQLPGDGEDDDSFSIMDDRISKRHIDTFFDVAGTVASAVAGESAHLGTLAGSCATQPSPTAECYRNFLESFGRRVFRRALKPEEVERYEELFDPGDGQESFRAAIFSFLMAPQFLYHLEIEGSQSGGNLLQLHPYELASRLSFHFWQTMPDETLLAAAESGELDTEAGYVAQVDRLFADARTDRTLHRFYEEWYLFAGFTGFVDNAQFTEFRQGVDDEGLHREMVDEVLDLIDYYTWEQDGSYLDVLTSPFSFARTPRLAGLYGMEPWDGTSPPPSFASGERSGLVTRAAMLVSGDANTNPFKRGAFIRQHILCDTLAQPFNLPPGSLVVPPPSGDTSTRERFEAKVADQQCQSCHGQFSDIGYALEAYDALGRFRATERIIDDFGTELATVSVDSVAVPRVEFEDEQPVNTPQELADRIANGEKAVACFARHYFRYVYRRNETLGDGCTMVNIRDRVGEGGSLRDALRDVALDPQFRQKMVE